MERHSIEEEIEDIEDRIKAYAVDIERRDILLRGAKDRRQVLEEILAWLNRELET